MTIRTSRARPAWLRAQPCLGDLEAGFVANDDEQSKTAAATIPGLSLVDECLPGDARVMVHGHGAMSLRDCVQSVHELEVLSFNHALGVSEFRRVVAHSTKVVRRRFVTLHVRRGTRTLKLRLTEEHPVYVDGRGYVPAIAVRAEDEVVALARYYPCPQCDAAFDSPSALGGHMSCLHGRGREAFERQRAPGGDCPYCGRVLATQGALRMHVRRHEDPAFDRRLREAKSACLRATNLRHNEALRNRMRAKNPTRLPHVREAIRKWHKAQSPDAYKHLTGGNGTGPTVPEQLLLERLGSQWTWQHVITTHAAGVGGLPRHYKIDLAHPQLRIALEVDGHSHQTDLARERDTRKERWLTEQGWLCLRVRNEVVRKDPDAAAAWVLEAIQCRK